MRVTTPTEIGAVVRRRRRRLGWTQRELAQRAGASRQWVVALEGGKGRAELGLVLTTLSVLDLEVDLVVREHERKPSGTAPVDLDAVLARVRGDR